MTRIVWRFSKEEQEAITHAFQEAIDRVKQGGGDQYAHSDLETLEKKTLKYLKESEKGANLCLVQSA